MISKIPPYPTPAIIDQYLVKWNDLNNYQLQERSLNLLFQSFCPKNSQMEHVLLKVCALNEFYSTNIYDTFSMALHVSNMQIDGRLSNNDLTLVNDIAPLQLKNRTIVFYSFASKYCNHHKPETYPIYDYYVARMLWHYSKYDGFAKFRRGDLDVYPNFVDTIHAFKNFYGLDEYSLRDIDVFLWIAGKECFPRKYY